MKKRQKLKTATSNHLNGMENYQFNSCSKSHTSRNQMRNAKIQKKIGYEWNQARCVWASGFCGALLTFNFLYPCLVIIMMNEEELSSMDFIQC